MNTNGYRHPMDAPRMNEPPQELSQNGRVRSTPFSVDEALAYSPMASVVPFNTGLIPLPTIGERASQSLYPTPAAEKAARHSLDLLNQPTSKEDGTEQRLGKALKDLQQLLRPSNLTQITFKQTASPRTRTDTFTYREDTRVSNFGNLLLKNTNVPFNQAQPSSHKHKRENFIKPSIPPSPLASLPVQRSLNEASLRLNGNTPRSQSRMSFPTEDNIKSLKHNLKPENINPNIVEAMATKVLAPMATHGGQQTTTRAVYDPVSKGTVVIEVPIASEVIRKEEYLTVSESNNKRDVSPDMILEGPDQRRQADDAFDALQEYLHNIFVSDDNPDTNNGLCSVIGDDVLSVTSPALSKVQSLLQRIIVAGRFSQVPVEDLVRLQRLLDGAIRAAGTANLRFDESWTDLDLSEYLQNLHVATIGLKSASTTLRIMSGGREDKQLYSEEALQASVGTLNNVLDSCIVPVVELRNAGMTSSIFKLLQSEKKTLRDLVVQCQRLLGRLRDLVTRIELSENVINSLEYTVSRLIFVENSPAEKDSVLGISKFDNLRVVAMDTLAQIFSTHTEQRTGIFAEILTSLEKLPVTKQSARQFRLASGGNIQLVSALIMRLIQTSANKSTEKSKRGGRGGSADDEEEEDPNAPAIQVVIGNGFPNAYDTEDRAMRYPSTSVHELRNIAQPLLETAKSSASYVVNFIVQRAINSTKTGDAPYRNLLDLFVQDFITCLGSSDWPAAELLLRMFVISMINLSESEKTPASARNMSLEFLGEVGAAISQLTAHVRRMATSLEGDDSDETSKSLLQLIEQFNEDKLNVHDITIWNGPYHLSLAYLNSRYVTDSSLESAVGYCAAQWAVYILEGFDAIEGEEESQVMQGGYGGLAYRLRTIITDKKSLSAQYNGTISREMQSQLAYALTLLHSPLCRAFNRILMILLSSTDSDQALVRSKGLKSFNLLLETDPTILDRGKNVIRIILNRSSDLSVAVRDSALGLIAKCITLRPALEKEALPDILRAVGDSNVSVRKRAIKLLRDVYLRNLSKDVRTAIADALLHRAKDPDEGVQELARQVIEEVWMAPFHGRKSSDDSSVQDKLAVADHVGLMVKTVQRSAEVSTVLDKVLQNSLSGTSKNSVANFKVCKTFVATLFDTIIGGPQMGAANKLETKDALQLLMTFAKANAKLFSNDQIQLLEPYITDVKTENDIAIFRPVVVIFRHVFPQLSNLHSQFLTSVRTTMMRTITRMNRVLLDDIFACLRIMSEVLESNDQLVRLMGSTIDPIRKFTKTNFCNPAQENNVKKLTRLFLITGMCGKHCDLDNQLAFFQQKFPEWKGSSVSQLMVDSFAPFASPSQPLEVRKAALDAIGLVCQSWPKNFISAKISTTFQAAFDDKIPALEQVIMRSFKEFFMSEEGRSDPDAEPVVGAADTPATLGVMGGSQHDGVSAFIHQKFMTYLTNIALSSEDEHALLATEVLTSINRQGLNHPKECGPTFVALETSGNPKIADLAFQEHHSIHQKYETIMEKEYMRAINSAYTYQKDVAKDTRGAIVVGSIYTPKLHMLIKVMEISKPKLRKRFYESLCTRLDFDQNKLEVPNPGPIPQHVDFARFVIENMAFFEYLTTEDLLITISAMEKVVAATGSTVAHALETEVFSLGIENMILDSIESATPAPPKTADPARLRQLTAASMILSLIWEARTHLRRQYGLMNRDPADTGRGRKESKSKVNAKDLNKAPTKAPFANGDKFWEESARIMQAWGSEEGCMNLCRNFVELLTVDKDFKIAAEGEDEIAEARLNTPSDDEDGSRSTPASGGRGRKRKAAGTPGGRKKRARSGSKSRSGRKKRGGSGDSDEYDGF